MKSPFGRDCPKVYRRSKNGSCQSFYIYFAMSAIEVDCKSFYRVRLPECDFPLVSIGSGGYVIPVGCPSWRTSECITSVGNNANCEVCVYFSNETWRDGCLLPESVDMQGSFSGISCWLRQVVLLNSVLCQLSRDGLLPNQMREFRCDCETSEIDFHLYIWK